MKVIKKIVFTLFLIIPFFCAKTTFAGFGVSPAEIYNDNLKPGAKFEKEIVLSRSELDESLKVLIETDLGEAESWIKFEPGKEFIFPKGEQRKTIKAIVSVPNNAQLKNYKGLLRIKASSTDSSNSGVSIIKGARMEVNLVTTSLNVDILNIKNLNIPNVDFQKPIKLLVTVENNGNTETAPSKIILEIQDLTQKVLKTQEITKLDKTAANTTKEITAEFENKLNSGEYFGIVKVFLGDKLLRSDRLVFKVGPAPEGYNPNSNSSSNTFKNVINSVITTISNNKVETIALIAIPILPTIIGFSIYKFGVLLVIKRFFLVGTIAYTLISLALTGIYHFQWKKSDMAKPGESGYVKGESVEVINTKNPTDSSLIIDKPSFYPIYRTPDTNSVVVYKAKENEKLNVISEQEDWYQVSTGEGTGGWLPKTSVKQVD